MADTIIDNINSIIRTKSELKSVLTENGQNPSDTFSEYPDMFRSAIEIAAASGANEETINSYISAYLSAYDFIDQDMLSANSYLTQHQDLSSYVTYSYADNKYFGRLTGISGLSDGNVISSIGESFDAGASVRGIYYQKTYVPSYAYIESYYISKSELSSAGYITSGDVASMGYITNIPSEYITDSELSACGYLTQHQDLSSYASKSYVADYVATYAPVPDLSSYALKTDLNSYVSKTELSNAGYLTSIPSEYITDAELSACGYITINDIPSVDTSTYVSYTYLSSNYPTYAYLNDTIVTAKGDWIEQVETMGYVTGADISNMGYATQSYVMDKIGAIPTVDLSSYALKSEIPVIDENLIPKKTNTYSLGDMSHLYFRTYTGRISGDNSGLWIDTNTNHRFFAGSTAFRPYSNNQYTLGTSDINWAYTYTYNLILNGTNIKDTINAMFSYDSSTGTLTITSLT